MTQTLVRFNRLPVHSCMLLLSSRPVPVFLGPSTIPHLVLAFQLPHGPLVDANLVQAPVPSVPDRHREQTRTRGR